MELVLAQLQEEGSECGVAPGVARFLADSFKANCGAVLKLSSESHVSDDEVRRVHWWDNLLYLFIFTFILPLSISLPVTDIQLLQFPLSPAGGANSDKSFERALRDYLRPQGIFVSPGSP